MIQGFAAGYFLWDLGICITNIGVFGWGLLAHAIAALVVFSFGFVSILPPSDVQKSPSSVDCQEIQAIWLATNPHFECE